MKKKNELTPTQQIARQVKLPSTRQMSHILNKMNSRHVHSQSVLQQMRLFFKAINLVESYKKDEETIRKRHGEGIVNLIENYIAKHDRTDSRDVGNASQAGKSS